MSISGVKESPHCALDCPFGVSTSVSAEREVQTRLFSAQLLGEKLLQREEQSPMVATLKRRAKTGNEVVAMSDSFAAMIQRETRVRRFDAPLDLRVMKDKVPEKESQSLFGLQAKGFK